MPEPGRERVAGLLREQAGWCERLGSPLYAGLLRRSAEDALAGGPTWDLLAPHAEAPGEIMLALRLMGSVHRLALDGRAPELARHYPSTGGRPGDAWPAFRQTLEEHADQVAGLLERPVQTNEVGRSSMLVGGFLTVADLAGLPLRCLEVGASAGLNLRWDRYRYESRGWRWGDAASRVRFRDVFEPGPVPAAPAVAVGERRGCDREPVDVDAQEGRLTLLSYVWPDMTERVERLRAALEIAREVPAPVDRADAVPWVEERLAEEAPGAATVVFHSIVAMYFDAERRRRFTDALEAAGERATAEAPLAWLAVEMAGERFETRLRMWPGGQDRLLALSGPHGPPVRWLAA